MSVRVGNLEMVTYVARSTGENSAACASDDEGPQKEVFTYPLTKIRSWKVGGKVCTCMHIDVCTCTTHVGINNPSVECTTVGVLQTVLLSTILPCGDTH